MSNVDKTQFTGRDLSAYVSPRRVIIGIAVLAVATGTATMLIAHNPDPARPMRGSIAAVVTDPINLAWSDISGLLGAALVGLIPFLQAMRCFTSRSVAGLSRSAWLLSLWAMLGTAIQGANTDDTALAYISVIAAVGVSLVLLAFVRFGDWSWPAVGWTLLLAGTSSALLAGAAVFDGLMWLACLIGVIPISSVIAVKMLWALITSPSRRGASQAVHLVGALGYSFWLIQAVLTDNVAMAATAIVMTIGFLCGLGVLLYLGVVSDDGTSAADIVLYRQVKLLPRAIAMHVPIFDPASRELVDIELRWANDNWQSYRTQNVPSGAVGSGHRVRFEQLLPFLRQAWAEGKSLQYFRLDRSVDQLPGYYAYNQSIWNADIEVETLFVRLESGMILEWGDDLDAKTRLGSQLEIQRQDSERQRIEIAARLAAQTEHSKFSRELHDNILQEMFVMSMRLEMARNGEGLTIDDATDLHTAIARVSGDIRSLIEDSTRLEQDSQLKNQLEELVSSWSKMEASDDLPTIALLDDVDDVVIDRLPQAFSKEIIAIAREAVSNAMRHSGASSVTIELLLEMSPGSGETALILKISDNGVGIPTEPGRQSGLANMQVRAANIGARLTFSSMNSSHPKRPGSVVAITAPIPTLSSI